MAGATLLCLLRMRARMVPAVVAGAAAVVAVV
jgi:hypothetical protein